MVTLSDNGGSFTDEINDGDTNSTNELLTGALLVGSTLELSDAGGTTQVDLSGLSVRAGSFIEDTNGDTRIDVEMTPDEDSIHFQIEGVERWLMANDR